MARGKPKPPAEDVKEKQDPEYSEADFERDLEKATRQLEDASPPEKRESKT
jgi:hypothetical protein